MPNEFRKTESTSVVYTWLYLYFTAFVSSIGYTLAGSMPNS